MHRLLIGAFALAFVLGLSGPIEAKNCRDAKGKFVKCKTTTSQKMPAKQCRDAKGKFVKCKAG